MSTHQTERLHFLSYIWILLLTAAGFAACTHDELDDGGMGTKCFRIEMATAEMTPESRAGSGGNLAANELIKDWFVLMVKDNRIEGIFRGNNGESNEKDTANVVTFSGTAGSRDFHCFANIAESEVVEMYQKAGFFPTGTQFNTGDVLPAVDELKKIGFPVQHTGIVPGSTGSDFRIPMSNIEEGVYVDENTTVKLYIYRVLSKVRFQFTNNCGVELTLKKITLGDVSSNDSASTGKPSQIYFFPPRNAQGAIETSFPKDASGNDIHRIENHEFFSGEEKLAVGATVQKEYYLSPSISNNHPTYHFPLWVEIEGVTGMETQRFALTSLTSIRRNSIITLPIYLTGYDMELKAFHYAPIGGYPAVSVTKKNDTEFYCTFAGSGEFALRPFVYAYADKDDQTKWIDINNTNVITSKSLAVEDPDGILNVVPKFNGGSEIVGSLNGRPGTATVKLTIDIKVSESLTQTYTRIFYVIHE